MTKPVRIFIFSEIDSIEEDLRAEEYEKRANGRLEQREPIDLAVLDVIMPEMGCVGGSGPRSWKERSNESCNRTDKPDDR